MKGRTENLNLKWSGPYRTSPDQPGPVMESFPHLLNVESSKTQTLHPGGFSGGSNIHENIYNNKKLLHLQTREESEAEKKLFWGIIHPGSFSGSSLNGFMAPKTIEWKQHT